MKATTLKKMSSLIVLTGVFFIPVSTQAATIENLSSDFVDLEKNYHFDLKKRYNRIETGIYSNISKDNFSLTNGFGEITSQRETNSEQVYLGENTFKNSSPTSQVFHTTNFSEMITNTVSSTTTNGFSVGTQTQGGISIPLIADGQFTINTEFNFSESDTNEQSNSKTYTVPSQDITVPAGKIYKTTVFLEKKRIEGTVDLFGKVNFNIKNHKPYFMPEQFINDVLFYNRDVEPPKFLNNAITTLVTTGWYNDFEFQNMTFENMWDDIENNYSSWDSGTWLETLKSKGLLRNDKGVLAKGEGAFAIDYATDLKVVTQEVDPYGNVVETVNVEEETPVVR